MQRILAALFMVKHHCIMQNLPRWMEVYGIPPRIGKYDPGNIDAKGKAALWQAIRHMGQDAGGIIPNTMQIDLLEAATGNADAFKGVAAMVDQYVSKAILGRDVVASGGLNGGSGTNEANNADMAHDLNVADCKQLARTITQDIGWPIVQYFGITDPREAPVYKIDTSEPADRKAIAEGIKAAQIAGVKIKRDWAHEQLQIPVPEEGDELLEAPAPAPPPFMPGAPQDTNEPGQPPKSAKAEPGAEPKKAGSGQLDDDDNGKPPARADAALTALLLTSLATQRAPARDPLDDAVDAMLDGWQPAMDDLLAPIRAAVAQAAANGETLASLQARLPELLADMDESKLAERIAQGQFLGQLAGSAGLLDPRKRSTGA
jgi:phage gp29-like protein